MDTSKLKGATLTYRKREQRFWIHLVFEAPPPEKQMAGEVQGIDRGLYHLAVTSDQQFYSNQKVRAVQRRYDHTRRRLQLKGTRSAKRRLRALSGREQRFKRNAAINFQQRYLLSVTDGSTEQAVVNQPPCGVDMPAMGHVECDLPR